MGGQPGHQLHGDVASNIQSDVDSVRADYSAKKVEVGSSPDQCNSGSSESKDEEPRLDHRAGTGALYWELVSQEPLEEYEGDGIGDPICHLVEVFGDILVFESLPRKSCLRRFSLEGQQWEERELPIVVHAAIRSPVDPAVVCILHCPSDWNSDHRYEVYAFHADTGELDPLWVSSSKSQQLVDAGIAPKMRHGFSVAPLGRCIYFLCGLQHFPGDATGSFVYCFDLDARVWTEVEYNGVFPAPFPEIPYRGCRFGQSCVVSGAKAWLFGGRVQHGSKGVVPTNDLMTFDLVEHQWEKERAAAGDFRPPKMSGHTALAIGHRMLLLSSEGASMDIYSFNITAKKWELLPPIMLGPRPADGRVVCCLSGRRLFAYQQWYEKQAAVTHRRKHELFSVDISEIVEALERTGAQHDALRQPRNRQELDLLGDDSTSDVAFSVEGRVMVAHRAVLMRFSPALARLLERADGSAIEGRTPIARIQDVKYGAFYSMMEHIYSRFTKVLTPPDAEALLELAQLFELTSMVERCQEKVVITASNVRHFLGLAVSSGQPLEVLSQKCIAYLTSHPEYLSLYAGGPAKRHNIPNAPGQPSPETWRAPQELPTTLPRTTDATAPIETASVASSVAVVAAAAMGGGLVGVVPGGIHRRYSGPGYDVAAKAAAAAAAAAMSCPPGSQRAAASDAFLSVGGMGLGAIGAWGGVGPTPSRSSPGGQNPCGSSSCNLRVESAASLETVGGGGVAGGVCGSFCAGIGAAEGTPRLPQVWDFPRQFSSGSSYAGRLGLPTATTSSGTRWLPQQAPQGQQQQRHQHLPSVPRAASPSPPPPTQRPQQQQHQQQHTQQHQQSPQQHPSSQQMQQQTPQQQPQQHQQQQQQHQQQKLQMKKPHPTSGSVSTSGHPIPPTTAGLPASWVAHLTPSTVAPPAQYYRQQSPYFYTTTTRSVKYS